MKGIRSRLTYANVMGSIAVFLALGGTTYAAVTLPTNSVGIKQIKKNAVGASEVRKNAVRSGEVKNGSLRRGDFAAGQLPQGPKGDQGVQGVQGAPAEDGPTAFARVQADGTLEPGSGTGPAQFKNVDASDIEKPSLGTYCFGDLGFDVASAVVAMDNAAAAATTTQVASVAIQRGANLNGCDAGHQQARVVITNVDPAIAAAAPQDGRFTIWFEGP